MLTGINQSINQFICREEITAISCNITL